MPYLKEQQHNVIDFWKMAGPQRIQAMFYNIYPEYVSRVPIDSVEMKEIPCPRCDISTLSAFSYLLLPFATNVFVVEFITTTLTVWY